MDNQTFDLSCLLFAAFFFPMIAFSVGLCVFHWAVCFIRVIDSIICFCIYSFSFPDTVERRERRGRRWRRGEKKLVGGEILIPYYWKNNNINHLSGSHRFSPPSPPSPPRPFLLFPLFRLHIEIIRLFSGRIINPIFG